MSCASGARRALRLSSAASEGVPAPSRRPCNRFGRLSVTRRRAVQVWPSFFSIEVNGHEALGALIFTAAQVFTTKVPLRGHKRRDLPQSLSANLRRGVNIVEVTAEDERRHGACILNGEDVSAVHLRNYF